MHAESAFPLLLAMLSLAGFGLFFAFYLLFDEQREIDPIYRPEPACSDGKNPQTCTVLSGLK